MGFNLGQIIISTLESVDELPIKKRRGWRKPLHSYYKWHGSDVGLGRRTLERKAALSKNISFANIFALKPR